MPPVMITEKEMNRNFFIAAFFSLPIIHYLLSLSIPVISLISWVM
jgi:hypothetical protein